MTTLDRVIEMQGKGFPTIEITKTLRDEGVNPQEIDDSLNQAQVKSAVSQDPSAQQNQPQLTQSAQPQTPQTTMQASNENMQQSIMQPPSQTTMQTSQQEAPPQPTEQPYPEQTLPQQGEQYYYETPQAYPEEAYYAQQPAINTDTITEITEQVVMEKFEDFKKKTGNIISFKNQAEETLKDLDERLKRIEKTIDNLQQAIIGKIGDFGDSTTAIHKDLDNLHTTVSKLMNPLVDNYKELKKFNQKKPSKSSA